MKRLSINILMTILTIFLFGSSCSSGDHEEQAISELPKFLTSIEVSCRDNWFLSRYDVKILIDDQEIGILDHGSTEIYEVTLESGMHTIRFESEEDSSVDGIESLSIQRDTSVKYYIHCHNDQIDVDTTYEIQPPLDASDLGSLTYSEVKTIFEEAGFSTISLTPIKDLSPEKLNDLNIVTRIIINDTDSFTKQDLFLADSPVTIEYHVEEDIVMPYPENHYLHRDVDDVINELRALGFKNIESETYSTNVLTEDNTVFSVRIDSTYFSEGSTYSKDANVTLKVNKYREDKEEVKDDISTKTLSKSVAREAFEDYGENLYVEFKPHWILDLINEEQIGNTWYFKVGVTITDFYGQEFDTVAEATVTGTDANPEVVDFYVSQ